MNKLDTEYLLIDNHAKKCEIRAPEVDALINFHKIFINLYIIPYETF